MPDLARHQLDQLLDRQAQAWRGGSRPAVGELLGGARLGDDPETELDLIYNEIVLREELGEEADRAEYAGRYPHLREELDLHFEVHDAMADPVLSQTAAVAVADTLPETPSLPPEATPDLPEYDVLDLLGRGGMGVVYEARHRRLRRLVALKTFAPERRPSPREVARFRTEAEAVARLQHPNIVQIFEVGERDGVPFLALELATGGTLAERLQRLPFAPRAAAELIAALAAAVHHAHAHGVIHRDLKPANVLFAADGTPKLTDFGLAKLLAADDHELPRDATRTGDPVGTPRYMAPEQAAGRHDLVGPTTDVYALGTLLYECLTGQVPFVSAGFLETLNLIRSADPRSPRTLQPTIPRDLETICLACLNKEPERRYPSAAALADDLRRFLDGKPIAARPTPPWERAWKWCRRRPTAAALLLVAVLAAVGGGVAAVLADRMKQERIATARAAVDGTVARGQDALAAGDDAGAEALFVDALTLVEGEPALADRKLHVAGWLDHARRAANRHHWKQRTPPRLFDERRDDAVFQSLLLDGTPGESIRRARAAVATALSFTLPNDPTWRAERERLALLDAALLRAESGPTAAVARLDAEPGATSRLFRTRRAVYLDQAGRAADAAAERDRADALPPDDTSARLFAGLDHLRAREFAAAAAAFDAVLDADPEQFAARLGAALSAFHLNRFGEAKAGLTACVAQRPRFAWSYLYRARCARAGGDLAAAMRDLRRGLDTVPPTPARVALLVELEAVHLQSNDPGAARAAREQANELLAGGE